MLNNLTTKFQEALMQAQQTAGRLGKPEISSLDVLVALLEQEGGILSPILRKASCDPGLLLQAAQREVSHEPTQSGATTQPQIGRDLATVIQAAEEERKKLKDDYLSVEHFMLGALDTQNKVHQLTDTFGLTKDNYLAAMKEVRGNQRVTDDNPEGKYQTLEKYGTDLTARARAGKIDPVIGRDTEIRPCFAILSRQDEKQSRPDRGTRRWQNRHCGRFGAAHSQRRRAGKACATSALFRSTSDPCSPGPNIAANLKSA